MTWWWAAAGFKKDDSAAISGPAGTLRDRLPAPAAGVALGRNVWQSSDPARTTRALADIIHRGKKPDELEGQKDIHEGARRTTKGHEEKLKEK